MTEKLKKCSVCKQRKPLTDFYRDKNMRSGYKSRCKQCHADYQAGAMIICSNCGDPERAIYVRGLCKRCHNYQWKRGRPRPLDLAPRREFTTDELLESAARFMRGESMTRIAASIGSNVKPTNLADAITGKTAKYRYILEFVPEDYVTAMRAYKARYGSRRLTPGQVRDLRKRRANGELLSELARRFRLCESTVSKIARGESYSEVGGPIAENQRVRVTLIEA